MAIPCSYMSIPPSLPNLHSQVVEDDTIASVYKTSADPYAAESQIATDALFTTLLVDMAIRDALGSIDPAAQNDVLDTRKTTDAGIEDAAAFGVSPAGSGEHSPSSHPPSVSSPYSLPSPDAELTPRATPAEFISSPDLARSDSIAVPDAELTPRLNRLSYISESDAASDCTVMPWHHKRTSSVGSVGTFGLGDYVSPSEDVKEDILEERDETTPAVDRELVDPLPPCIEGLPHDQAVQDASIRKVHITDRLEEAHIVSDPQENGLEQPTIITISHGVEEELETSTIHTNDYDNEQLATSFAARTSWDTPAEACISPRFLSEIWDSQAKYYSRPPHVRRISAMSAPTTYHDVFDEEGYAGARGVAVEEARRAVERGLRETMRNKHHPDARESANAEGLFGMLRDWFSGKGNGATEGELVVGSCDRGSVLSRRTSMRSSIRERASHSSLGSSYNRGFSGWDAELGRSRPKRKGWSYGVAGSIYGSETDSVTMEALHDEEVDDDVAFDVDVEDRFVFGESTGWFDHHHEYEDSIDQPDNNEEVDNELADPYRNSLILQQNTSHLRASPIPTLTDTHPLQAVAPPLARTTSYTMAVSTLPPPLPHRPASAPIIPTIVPTVYQKLGIWISVSDPTLVKKKRGGSYTSYKITVRLLRPNVSGYGNPTATTSVIWRRYREFRDFYNTLMKFGRLDGCVDGHSVPQFPKKSFFDRFNHNVISTRLQAFARLLDFVAGHERLFNSGPVVRFLGVGAGGMAKVEKEGRKALDFGRKGKERSWSLPI